MTSGTIARAAAQEQSPLTEADAAWLAEQGFDVELGGGGALFLSLYLPGGAYVWLTGADGGFGMASAEDFTACAYPAGWDGEDPDCDLRSGDADSLSFRDAVTRAVAVAKGEG